MKLADALDVVALIQAAYPRQPWPDETVNLLAGELERLDIAPDQAASSVMTLLRTRRSSNGGEWPPPLGDILDAVVSDLDQAPSFDAAWAEMSAHASSGDYFRPERIPPMSHPAVERLAERVGWVTFCRSDAGDPFLRRQAESLYAAVLIDRFTAAMGRPTDLAEMLGPRSVGELSEPVRELVAGIGEGEETG